MVVDEPWKEDEEMEMPEGRTKDAWKKEPWSFSHKEIGTRISGLFYGKIYDGTVTRVLESYVDRW